MPRKKNTEPEKSALEPEVIPADEARSEEIEAPGVEAENEEIDDDVIDEIEESDEDADDDAEDEEEDEDSDDENEIFLDEAENDDEDESDDDADESDDGEEEAAEDESSEDEEEIPAPSPAKLERLQKILAQAGVASRRAAEEMVTSGRVQVNGQVVTTLGSKADPTRDHIRVDGKLLQGAERLRYYMLNKPKGFVTTVKDPEGRPTVMEFFAKMKERVYPIGRLDYLSEGLLLVTNDGDLAHKLTRAASGVEKTYLVKVAGQPTEEELDRLRTGVMIQRGQPGEGVVRTSPARIRQVRLGDNPWFEVILIEGRNRELRKMFEEIGHFVEKIRRVGYGPLALDLEPGKMRELDEEELNQLRLAADGKLPRNRFGLLVTPLEKQMPTVHPFASEERPRGQGRQNWEKGRPARRDDRGARPARPYGARDAGARPARDGEFRPAAAQGEGDRPAKPRFEGQGEGSRPQGGRPQGQDRRPGTFGGPKYGGSKFGGRSGGPRYGGGSSDRPGGHSGNRPSARPAWEHRDRPEGDRPAGDRPTSYNRPRPEGGNNFARPAGGGFNRGPRPGGQGGFENRGGERSSFRPTGGAGRPSGPRREGGYESRPPRNFDDRGARPSSFRPRPEGGGEGRPQGPRSSDSFENRGAGRPPFKPRYENRGEGGGRPPFKPRFEGRSSGPQDRPARSGNFGSGRPAGEGGRPQFDRPARSGSGPARSDSRPGGGFAGRSERPAYGAGRPSGGGGFKPRSGGFSKPGGSSRPGGFKPRPGGFKPGGKPGGFGGRPGGFGGKKRG